MNVALRCDASVGIGSGHVMRCLQLARALRERGAVVRFVCRRQPGAMNEFLAREGWHVAELPGSESGASCVTDAEDAQQTLEALAGQPMDWLVVDHYGLDARWESPMRGGAGKIMVIDDLADRRHDCDLLLDQNFRSDSLSPYTARVPLTCRQLTGPRYALLALPFRVARQRLRPRDGSVARVLVSFGGSDADNITGLALEALDHPEFAHLDVDVVMGPLNPHSALLERQIAARPRTHLHRQVPHLANLMAQADLAIGAGGSTTWERMCLGLPAIIVSVAPNQYPGCEALSAAGLIDYAGPAATVTASSLRLQFSACLAQPLRLAHMSSKGQMQVDGWGALRAAEALMPTPAGDLQLRRARPDDVQCYFDWACDPQVRLHSNRSAPIAWGDHRSWFAAKLADSASYLFVLQAGNLPVGQIRFDEDDGWLRLSFSLDSLVRGRRWASHLVGLGLREIEMLGGGRVLAQAKRENAASCAVFERLPFTELPLGNDAGLRSFEVMLPYR